ncbi:MAG: DUF6765 family protein [Bdellovibrionales bacterium]
MQLDIHYYATYAIARIAEISPQDAHIIAYAAQFVDDSTENNSRRHKDGGLLYGVATAHHLPKIFLSTIAKLKDKLFKKSVTDVMQRRLWIPFHFYPGNEGKNLSERLLCQKNSKLVNEMFDNHIKHAHEFSFSLHLIGIASHVYYDTFSHYGFSGVSSRNNVVNIRSIGSKDDEDKRKIEKRKKNFFRKYKSEFALKNWTPRKKKNFLKNLRSEFTFKHWTPEQRKEFFKNLRSEFTFKHWTPEQRTDFFKKLRLEFSPKNWSEKKGFFKKLGAEFTLKKWRIRKERFKSIGGQLAGGYLGHGGVCDFPDIPYLNWYFKYQDNNQASERNNIENCLEGAIHLYEKLKNFSEKYYNKSITHKLEKEKIKAILETKGNRKFRCNLWKQEIEKSHLFQLEQEDKQYLSYDPSDWENQKKSNFEKLNKSEDVSKLDIYKFHQAADYHRHYTLKNLLPKHGIVIN